MVRFMRDRYALKVLLRTRKFLPGFAAVRVRGDFGLGELDGLECSLVTLLMIRDWARPATEVSLRRKEEKRESGKLAGRPVWVVADLLGRPLRTSMRQVAAVLLGGSLSLFERLQVFRTTCAPVAVARLLDLVLTVLGVLG